MKFYKIYKNNDKKYIFKKLLWGKNVIYLIQNSDAM